MRTCAGLGLIPRLSGGRTAPVLEHPEGMARMVKNLANRGCEKGGVDSIE